MSGNSNRLVAFNYFGGKNTWVDLITPYFPPHEHFVDVFGGSAALTLNKPKSKIETFNDLNGDVVNFFRQLRENPDPLIKLLQLTPVSRGEYQACWPIYDPDNPCGMEWARRFYVRCRQSYAGLGAQGKGKGWHMTRMSNRSNLPESVGRWKGGIDQLMAVADRLSQVQIEKRDFRKLIPAIAYDGALFYLDPPYDMAVRNCRKKGDYLFDFSLQDHYDLADLATSQPGYYILSGYDSPLMQELYEGWHFVKLPVKHNNIRNGQVQECLWLSFDPYRELNQLSIFSQIEK